jgi:N-methylhydantoinase A
MAAEVGGTFTDLVWVSETGDIETHKVPSTPSDPSTGVIRGLDETLEPRSETVSQLFHGSTVATNAVLEREGCEVGLLTTEGFGDVLQIQRQQRPNVYATDVQKPEPLVSLDRIGEVTERISADGEVLVPLDEESLVATATDLVDGGVEALAVCFLHAYKSPVHEARAVEVLEDRFPDVPVTRSSGVLPTFREYERTSTTVMNAYLDPLVDQYVGRLEDHLEERAGGAPLFIMQSSGGVVPGDGARSRPVDMLQSGPAAAVMGATEVGDALGDDDVITLDMGGTSTDVSLITDGTAEISAEREVAGLPVGVSSVDIENVGAGGGSLGWTDEGGMLKVGPRSAGARPGPACYGRGGTDPALTDALVRLGWIRPETFLGGRMPLDADAADRALATLAETLDSTVDDTAQAMVDIAVAHINRCVRLVSVQRGYNPKQYAIYAFGGMGPMMGALVADEIQVDRVVIPPHPGLFSAVGLLTSDLKRVYRRTAFTPVTASTPADVVETVGEMRATATAEFEAYGYDPADIRWETSLELRYRGQGFELPVRVDLDRLESDGRAYIEDRFHEAHRKRYGTAVPSDDIELVTYESIARVPGDRNVLSKLDDRTSTADAVDTDEGAVRFGGDERACTFVRREDLTPGYSLEGLAIVEEPTSTTVVPPGWRLEVGPVGTLVLEEGGSE